MTTTSAPFSNHPLVLVDGSSYLYRAFHGLPPLTNTKGAPTGAIYGVLRMLKKLVAQYQPTHMAVIFDAKGKTFRNDLYAQYKANRPPMPDDLRSQIAPLHALIRAIGLPLVEVSGVEADDVMGTLALMASQQGWATVISTGDKDLAQVVNEHVTLVNTMSDTKLDPAGVVEKFGVRPNQIIDYLALIGDTSDNIPGVPKVGPKTAAKWLAEYGSIDELLVHANDIKGKIGENLRASLDQIPLSRALTTIKTDVPLDFGWAQLQLQSPQVDTIGQLYQELEFKNPNEWNSLSTEQTKTVASVIEASASVLSPVTPVTYETIVSEEALQRWLAILEAADYFSFDTETTSLNYMTASIVGLSFCVEAGIAAYIPLAHDEASPQLPRDQVLLRFKPLLENAAKAKLGQNLKYDKNVLANHGIELKGIVYDTMLESYVLDSTERHNMDSLAKKHLGIDTIHFEDIAGKGAKQLTFNQISIAKAAPYAAEDADITLRLHQHFWPKLAQEPSLRKVFEEIEMPLLPILSKIERTGVLVDAAMLGEQSQQLAQRLTELESQAWSVAGETFNVGSPKQLQTILYDKLGIPVLQKTPTGQPSTAESVLSDLAERYELPKVILEYRSLSKLKSTYTDRLPEQICAYTGRVHTSYHQAVAATGRLSSSDPNLQNIPVRTEEGRRIRQAFVAPAGAKILAADYSQIELRIMAHLSSDKGLLQAFASGSDVHSATAAEVFAVPLEQVTKDQRRSAKAINFGLIYGMSAFGLAKQLSIGRNEAQAYVDLYFRRYPGVKEYMESTRAFARQQGYVETLLGRRLYVPDINARNAQMRQYAERTAINAPMQGTAADIIKLAMIRIDQWLQTAQIGCRMIMQVHDELVFEVQEADVEIAKREIPVHMASVINMAVPLEVAVGVGDNWNEAH